VEEGCSETMSGEEEAWNPTEAVEEEEMEESSSTRTEGDEIPQAGVS
jgi:hypothetical protein